MTGKMYKIVLGTLAAALMAGNAMAADLNDNFEETTPRIDAATYDWSGAYVGVTAGFGFLGEFGEGSALASDNANGFIGGGLLGYNFQHGQWVFGVEGDISYTDIDAGAAGISGEIDYLGTITGRVGYTPVDRILTYVEGGYAFGEVDLSSAGVQDENFLNGFVVGTGVDYAVTKRISTGFQYNYVNLGEEAFNLGAAGTQTSGFDGHNFRANVKLKF